MYKPLQRVAVVLGVVWSAAVSAQQPNAQQYLEAFDGALTCSALSYLNTKGMSEDEAWMWANRSFAFGMLAVKFYIDATGDGIPAEKIREMRDQYVKVLEGLSTEKITPFVQVCAQKFAEVDALCREQACLHLPPAAETPGD
jgi:hypothetical protein